MPSPFPGMDPYLEDPALWPDVHNRLIAEIQTNLNQQLRPKYFARVEERVYISDENDPSRQLIVPDLRVAERPEWPGGPFQSAGSPSVATLETAEPIEIRVLDDEVREPYLEIVDREFRQVVTLIEVTSPSNKIPGARGRDSYLQKRQEIIRSSSHWLEIDLLRAGLRVTPLGLLPACDYIVCLSRVQRRPAAMIWPILLRQRLPILPIPLRGEDPDAKLDLQAVLYTAYDRAGYDLMVDYTKDPVPPLPPERADWAQELLRQQGRRSESV